ncbi:MAG: hypothetical protein FWC41_02705 [Firmicutes bacterium]|nr:hypothetical protein [Bacillota bacterium]
MLKHLKNNFVIGGLTLISSILITILYCLKNYEELNTLCFLQNGIFILGTIVSMVICGSIFLLSVDAIILKNVKFKERIFYTMKSLWLSQFIVLPIILILFLINFFVDLEFSIINKIVVFTISYLSQIFLFFSYKFVTKYDWATTIKVVASQSILTICLSILLKFI